MARPRSKTFIDLFAGAGGLTLGFKLAGLEPVFAVEIDPWAARTYKTNFGAHVLDHPIETVHSFPAADLVIGGPPCQGFSPLGRDRDEGSRTELNRLWRHFLRAVELVRPGAFLIENVPEFLKSDQFAAFLRAAKRRIPEYEVDCRVLNAADFGVPQRRRYLVQGLDSRNGLGRLMDRSRPRVSRSSRYAMRSVTSRRFQPTSICTGAGILALSQSSGTRPFPKEGIASTSLRTGLTYFRTVGRTRSRERQMCSAVCGGIGPL
jgi:DNA-cytosine methyltransferase